MMKSGERSGGGGGVGLLKGNERLNGWMGDESDERQGYIYEAEIEGYIYEVFKGCKDELIDKECMKGYGDVVMDFWN